MSCHEMGCMTGKFILGIYLVNISARMVATNKNLFWNNFCKKHYEFHAQFLETPFFRVEFEDAKFPLALRK